VLVIDECFPAGTKILTPNGEKNIEQLKIGDEVINAVGVGKIKCIRKREAEIITLYLSNGKQIKTTANHPFFTEQGWVAAKDLCGKKLFTFYSIFDIMSLDIISKGGKSNESNRGAMSMVRKDIHKEQPNTTFLWNILFSEMEKFYTRNKTEKFLSREKQENKPKIERSTSQKSKHSKATVLTNEGKQPYEQSRNKTKDEQYLKKDGSLPKSSDWCKWKTSTQSTTNPMGNIRPELENRICGKNQNAQKFRLPTVLQSRYSTTFGKDLDRSRWWSHQQTEKEILDKKKEDFLETLGWKGLRFQNQEIEENLPKVLSIISKFLDIHHILQKDF
jgi:hypothetical protein